MNILLFATAPSIEQPKIASFVFARIKVLQELGHSITVIQHGNILIGFPKLKGLSKESIINFLKECKLFILKRRNHFFIYEQGGVQYRYYNSIYFSTFKKFKTWFKKNNFNFIHAHFLWCCDKLPKIKKKCDIPFIVTVHGTDMHTKPFVSSKNKKNTLAILNSSNGVFFVSEFLHKKSLEIGWNGHNYIISGNGFFPELFFPKTKKFIDKDNVLLGYIGNPVAIKGFNILPDILFEVRKTYPNTRLLCVGSTGKENDLRDSVRIRLEELNILEAVSFIDKVPYEQIPDFMRKIDILLIPSLMEGFCCVALEAQACGTPVISSSSGGLPESTGNIGLCVDISENFVNNFSKKIISYIKNPYDIKTILQASEGRSWNNIVKKEVSAYMQFINI